MEAKNKKKPMRSRYKPHGGTQKKAELSNQFLTMFASALVICLSFQSSAQMPNLTFFKKRGGVSIIYENGGFATTTMNATRGATHQDGQNLAYIGFGYSTSSSSRTYVDFLWDGITGDFNLGGVSNLNSEHKGAGVGLINVTAADYTKTMSMSMSASSTMAYGFVRLIGGSGNVTHVASAVRGSNPTYPVTHNLSVQKGDFVVVFANVRTSAGHTFSATNMTNLWAQLYGSNAWCLAYIAVVDSTGTFTTTLNSTNHTQQWVDGYAIFRPSP